jgi:hypothetical protein
MGHQRAASCTSVEFLNVTMPLNDRCAPISTQRCASAAPPVKQWKTVRSGMPSAVRMSNVSSHASRVWMMSGRLRSWANWICAAKAARCTSRGEWS